MVLHSWQPCFFEPFIRLALGQAASASSIKLRGLNVFPPTGIKCINTIFVVLYLILIFFYSQHSISSGNESQSSFLSLSQHFFLLQPYSFTYRIPPSYLLSPPPLNCPLAPQFHWKILLKSSVFHFEPLLDISSKSSTQVLVVKMVVVV